MKVSEGWLQEFRVCYVYIVMTSKVVKRGGVGGKSRSCISERSL